MAANRHARRAARNRHNRFYRNYIRHLEQVPLDAPCERGQVYHLVVFHDPACRFYDREQLTDCDCTPLVKRYRDPVRS